MNSSRFLCILVRAHFPVSIIILLSIFFAYFIPINYSFEEIIELLNNAIIQKNKRKERGENTIYVQIEQIDGQLFPQPSFYSYFVNSRYFNCHRTHEPVIPIILKFDT